MYFSYMFTTQAPYYKCASARGGDASQVGLGGLTRGAAQLIIHRYSEYIFCGLRADLGTFKLCDPLDGCRYRSGLRQLAYEAVGDGFGLVNGWGEVPM